jgi:hypothetical protein
MAWTLITRKRLEKGFLMPPGVILALYLGVGGTGVGPSIVGLRKLSLSSSALP